MPLALCTDSSQDYCTVRGSGGWLEKSPTHTQARRRTVRTLWPGVVPASLLSYIALAVGWVRKVPCFSLPGWVDCSTPAGTRGWLWESTHGGFEIYICFFLLLVRWGDQPSVWLSFILDLNVFKAFCSWSQAKCAFRILSTARNEEKRVRR